MAKRPTVMCRECVQRFPEDDLVEGCRLGNAL